MKNYNYTSYNALRNVVLSIVLFGAAAVQALNTKALLLEGPSRTLLERKKPIYCETAGHVPVSYSGAMKLFSQQDLMLNIQQAYTELIIDEGVAEFSIQKTSATEYHYVNRKGERTDIVEMMRKKTSDSTFDIVLYSTGKRFFGKYQALIHVQLQDCKKEGVAYVASVYAYPENAISRFFARHLGLVTKYFNKKTASLSEMIAVISCRLCADEIVQEEDNESGDKTS